MNDSRSEKFVPLALAASAPRNRAEFQVTVLTQAEQAQALQSVGPKPAATPVPQAPTCEPKVTLQREGERVTAIHIECTCGLIIELACDY